MRSYECKSRRNCILSKWSNNTSNHILLEVMGTAVSSSYTSQSGIQTLTISPLCL